MDAEELVIQHTKYLLASGIFKDVETAVNQAISVCVPCNYFQQVAQMYDILICQAKDNFKKCVLEKMTNETL